MGIYPPKRKFDFLSALDAVSPLSSCFQTAIVLVRSFFCSGLLAFVLTARRHLCSVTFRAGDTLRLFLKQVGAPLRMHLLAGCAPAAGCVHAHVMPVTTPLVVCFAPARTRSRLRVPHFSAGRLSCNHASVLFTKSSSCIVHLCRPHPP